MFQLFGTAPHSLRKRLFEATLGAPSPFRFSALPLYESLRPVDLKINCGVFNSCCLPSPYPTRSAPNTFEGRAYSSCAATS